MEQIIIQNQLQGSDKFSDKPEHALTDRELEVFTMIDQGVSTKRIAEKLILSPKTIESHREKTRVNR